MKHPVHYGIVVSNSVDKKSFIHQILSKKNTGDLSIYNAYDGRLFSDLAIAECIEREDRHHTIEVATVQNRPLRTFSSGERRQLFLDYCIAKSPDYIIFDNPFDHLDQPSRQVLIDRLLELSESVSILQLANQEESLLPFIKNRGFVSENSFQVAKRKITNPAAISGHASEFPSALLSFKKHYDIIVKFHQVSISYEGQQVVKNISWEVNQGEFWQLIGPNGAGKSTLLSLITGDNPKAFGQDIIIFDRKKGSGESIWDIKRNFGYFSTHLTELFKRNHTVEQMLLSGFFDSIGLYVKPSGLQQKKALQWLDVINMKHLRQVSFNRLSLGQQRLVLICRALIKQPPLLILDEPLEGLDSENTVLVSQLINTLVENTEITIIYVSHTIEKSLVPSHIYELIPTPEGSIGQIKV